MKWRDILFREIRLPGDRSRAGRTGLLSRTWKWLFSWRSVRTALFLVIALATLVALFYVVENWRGRYLWKSYRAAAERRGINFNYRNFVPPPVSDEVNFAANALFKPIFDYHSQDGRIVWRDTNGWERVRQMGIHFSYPSEAPELGDVARGVRTALEDWQRYYRGEYWPSNAAPRKAQPSFNAKEKFPAPAQPQSPGADVLLALAKFDSEMRELAVDARRPHSRFPIHYDEGWMTLLPHLGQTLKFQRMFRLRAEAQLSAGNSLAAFEDVRTAFALADASKTEPFVISRLVRCRTLNEASSSLWEGMCRHAWSEEQLAEVQQRLARLNLMDEFIETLAAARAFQTMNVEQQIRQREQFIQSWRNMMPQSSYQNGLFLPYARYAPSGWFYQNEIVFNRRVDQMSAAAARAKATGVYTPLTWRVENESPRFTLFVDWPLQVFSNSVVQFPLTHVRMQLAQVACALERFHLARGHYPDLLDALSPQFIARVPADFMDGKPLRYRRLNEHSFLLYSVGLNETDDGGSYPPGGNAQGGDWVWRVP